MPSLLRHILSWAVVASFALAALAAPAATAPISLRVLAGWRGLQLSAAVNVEALAYDNAYRETLAREFNTVVPENAMKWEVIQPQRGVYDFAAADAVVKYAEAYGLAVRGHTLVWHLQLPSWLAYRTWSRSELMAILHDYIATVVGRYRGKVAAWDVVNEAVEADGSLLDNVWLRGIGPDYIELAFRWAREADPDALLFYNDYGIDGFDRKANTVFAMIRDMKARGVPIDGVGLQMHTALAWPPDFPTLSAAMARWATLGVRVRISEMDIRIWEESGTPQQKLAAQATIYGDVITACLTQPACDGFGLWGFTDKYSWVYGLTGHAYPAEAPLIFDPEYRPKPAYDALQQALVGDRQFLSLPLLRRGADIQIPRQLPWP